MIGFGHGHLRRVTLLASLCSLALGASSCSEAAEAMGPEVRTTRQAQLGDLPGVGDLAEQCGLDINCEAGGIAEGNASISGVASVDAFFGAVINFQNTALSVAGGIDAELEAIRADFGIEAGTELSAGIMAQASAHLEGGLTIEVEEPRCEVDASATLDAQAKCEAMVDPGSVMVACEGGCEVEASAEVSCDAEADLNCTLKAPSVACSGECKGSCTLEGSAAADCSGTCKGGCNGNCSLMNASGECEGKCEGTCTGSCEMELEVAASCEGSCSGECTVQNPEGGCEGGIRAECKAKAGGMVMCDGRCDGEVTPPSASAECDASVKAEASLNVECKPPSIRIDYELAVGGNVDVEAQAKFVAALENLKVRLPKLKAALAKADLVAKAGAGLAASADGAVKGAINTSLEGDVSLQAKFGLGCALMELGAVEGAISTASGRLSASVDASVELTSGLGL